MDGKAILNQWLESEYDGGWARDKSGEWMIPTHHQHLVDAIDAALAAARRGERERCIEIFRRLPIKNAIRAIRALPVEE